jgi:hypothetical protein
MARVIQTPIYGGAPRRITSILGTGTYVVPDDISVIRIYVTAGGGGGGSHNTDDAQGGGGAGGTAIKLLDVTPGTQYYCTIGGGGAAGSGNTSGSAQGGASSFGSVCSATGGSGVPTWGAGGRGGVGSGGDLNLYGSDGHTGNIDGTGNSESGGNGGDSYWNGAGSGGTHWRQRQDPQGWGCGGSGSHATTANNGTNGKQGAVVIEEYQ